MFPCFSLSSVEPQFYGDGVRFSFVRSVCLGIVASRSLAVSFRVREPIVG
jgi:hypothetical protein